MEVEKVVKEFIQPERPVVNRIINCGDNKTKSESPPRYEEVEDYESVYDKYENVISSFKTER